jgi:transcriptional regulator with XRE-family HTH domain
MNTFRIIAAVSGAMPGAKLRAIREDLGMTQQTMAGHLGTTQNTIARWERDEMSIPESVSKLVRIVSIILKPSTKGKR